jgi:hypothetical protein
VLDETMADAIQNFAGRDALVRARVGVTAIFFANGLAIGAWAVANLRSRRCSRFPTEDFP